MSSKTKQVIIPYTPRPGQRKIHAELDRHRWSVLVIHRRWGKTVCLLNQLIKRAMTAELDNSRYVYVAPFLKQAKTLAWDYLKRFTDPIPGRTYSESELRVNLPNGSQIRLFGADNPDALRGIYCDGAVLDEYAQCNPTIFTSILRPALSDRGGWCIFSGTPNGKNHFHAMLHHAQNDPTWYNVILKASETNVVAKQELADAQQPMTEEEYEREYECSFNSILGKKIYPEFNRNIHVSSVPLLPKEPTKIYRGWDNTGLSPAIIFTYLTPMNQWRLFKEFCFFDVGIMEATESIILWGNINLPPGCTFTDYADPAGKNRDSIKMSPRSYITIKAREFGQDIFLQDGIQTWKIRRESVANRLNRTMNGEPALLIDPECELVIGGFEGGYSYRELANLPGIFAEEAVKNEYSHIHDAIQYPATRLFTSNSSTMSINGNGEYISDEDEEYYFQQSLSGKSRVTGY